MKILIVGAGLTGCTIAEKLAKVGHQIDVIEKRNHIAGNAFDVRNEFGIRVHKYGPHLFHTNNDKVIAYLSKFTEWSPYRHHVKALLASGEYVTFPPNLETEKIVGKENLVDVLYRPYSEKMWEMKLEELNPAIINRVPIRNNNCDLYFPNDKFQALPKDGYTVMADEMLQHENINVELQTDFDKSMEADYDFIFNAMSIDEYYDFRFGELPYRSIKFNHQHSEVEFAQPAAVINFTKADGYTRCTEWKHLPEHSGDNANRTTQTYELPCDYKDTGERYYPIQDADGANRKLYKKYAAIPHDKMQFVGRCGQYVYIDMHQAVNQALIISNQFIKRAAQ